MPLGALGRLAGDQHRLAERRRLFLDPAGVGDHEVGAGEQAGEGRVAERLGEQDVVEAAEPFGQHLAHARVGCTGRTKWTSGWPRRGGDARRRSRCRPSPQFSRRWAVMTTIRRVAVVQRLQLRVGEVDVDLRGPVQGVDPGVAGDEDLARPGCSRGPGSRGSPRSGRSAAPAMDEITCRLSSSGNGVRLRPPVRRPASTCITGIRRWKAESAAAIAELVSPWTRTAAGRRPLRVSSTVGTASGSSSKRSTQKSSKRRITEETRSFRLERREPAQSDDVGLDVGQLEDVLDHAVVLAGGDDDRLVVLALAQGEDDRHQLDRLRTGADDDRNDQLCGGLEPRGPPRDRVAARRRHPARVRTERVHGLSLSPSPTSGFDIDSGRRIHLRRRRTPVRPAILPGHVRAEDSTGVNCSSAPPPAASPSPFPGCGSDGGGDSTAATSASVPKPEGEAGGGNLARRPQARGPRPRHHRPFERLHEGLGGLQRALRRRPSPGDRRSERRRRRPRRGPLGGTARRHRRPPLRRPQLRRLLDRRRRRRDRPPQARLDFGRPRPPGRRRSAPAPS